MSSKRSIGAVADGAGAQEEEPDKKKAANLELPDYIVEYSPILVRMLQNGRRFLCHRRWFARLRTLCRPTGLVTSGS